jgi:hypothetical protein
MTHTPQAIQFLSDSEHALNHLFDDLGEYGKILSDSQIAVEEFKNSQEILSDSFMYRDQWSPNANHHHAQYMERMDALEKEKAEVAKDTDKKIESALLRIGSTMESMSSLAAAVLQIAKQAISLSHSDKPSLPSARKIGSQSIVEVIWEGRNHGMHWGEGSPRPKVKAMLDTLTRDKAITMEAKTNNCVSILGALDWKSSADAIADLKLIV